MPWSETNKPWDDASVQDHIRNTFPITSQLTKPAFQAPIRTADDLVQSFDVTLTELRAALTKAVTATKEKTDQPPAQVVNSCDRIG
jgi:hypothetical protein